jgi:hypothetical protein
MKLSRAFSATLLVLTVLFEFPVFAQSLFSFNSLLNTGRQKEVMQDSEFLPTGQAIGNFYGNPLRMDGQPLEYSTFKIKSKGELTVIKGDAVTGQTIQIPFYIYLRRNGTMVKLPGEDLLKSKHMKIEMSTILELAEPGDRLIVEPANKEDWKAKRILKLFGDDGC